MNSARRALLVGAGSLAATAGLPLAAVAQTASPAQGWPRGPARIIVPNVPGGALDLLARMLETELSKAWKQQIIVAFKPGAGSSMHLAGEQLNLLTGIEMLHIPDRGAGGAYGDVFDGRVQLLSIRFQLDAACQGGQAQADRGDGRCARPERSPAFLLPSCFPISISRAISASACRARRRRRSSPRSTST